MVCELYYHVINIMVQYEKVAIVHYDRGKLRKKSWLFGELTLLKTLFRRFSAELHNTCQPRHITINGAQRRRKVWCRRDAEV